MKKAMITFAVVAIAATVQAATVQWGSGAIYSPGADGQFTTSRLGANTVSYYLWTMDADAYASTTLESIAKLDTATASASGKNSALGGSMIYQDKTSFGAGDTVNRAIIFIYTDGDGKEWFANKGSGTIDALGSQLPSGTSRPRLRPTRRLAAGRPSRSRRAGCSSFSAWRASPFVAGVRNRRKAK